jgi:hypothetical protein
MATIANLNILLTMQDDATKTLSKAQRDIDKLGKSIRKAGAWTTAAVTTPIIAATGLAIKMASDQQEAINAVNEVYGSGAATVLAYGDAAAQSMGLAKAEYLSAAAVFGVYSTAAGLAGQEAAEFANANLQLAADLGSFFNASTEDVTSALQAAYRGEFDALDRYGIMLNQTTLEQFALAEGIHDGNGAMTTQQRILATNAYMQQRAGAATGDFARTSNSLANSQKILRAQIKDVGAQLGNVLLPTVTRVVAVFRELLTRFQGLPESWQRWIVLIALAVAAIGPLLIVLGTILTMLPAIGAAFAVLTGPIGLVVAAIALLTAAYVGNWWGFRDAVDGVAGAVKSAYDRFTALYDMFRGWGETPVQAFFSALGVQIRQLTGIPVSEWFSRIGDVVQRTIDAFTKFGGAILDGDWRRALEGLGDILSLPFKHLGDAIKGLDLGFEPLNRVLDDIGNTFTDLGRIFQEVFQGDFSGALEVFKRMIGRVPEIVTGAFNLIPWSGVGETLRAGFAALPGFIADASTALYQKGRDLLKGVVSGLNDEMATVTAWLGLVGTIAGDAVGDVTQSLTMKGKQLLGSIVTGFNERLENVQEVFKGLPAILIAAVGDVTESLAQKGTDLIDGLMSGWATAWETASTTIGLLGTAAQMAVGDVTTAIESKGTELIDGLMNGWANAWTLAKATVGALGGVVVAAVGDLSSTLFSAGWNLIEGLANGILARIPFLEGVARTAAGVVGDIVRAINIISSPSRYMMELGGYMAEGLALGIERGIPSIESAAGAMSAAANVSLGADSGRSRQGTMAGGGGFINYGIYNAPDNLPVSHLEMRSHAMARRRG